MTEEIKVPDDLQPIYEAVSSGAMALGGHMAKEIIERIGSVEGILERTTDLVRFMRHELFDAELISDEEFAAEASRAAAYAASGRDFDLLSIIQKVVEKEGK